MIDYPLERLDGKRFQALAQALVVKANPNAQCFPLTGPDGGRDMTVGSSGNRVVFQAKFWEPNPLLEPTSDKVFDWLHDAISGEADKINALSERGLSKYVLVTNAPASGHLDSGLVDRVQTALNAIVPVGVEAQCWWRNDIERRLDDSFDIVMHYQLVQGVDAFRVALQNQLAGSTSAITLTQTDPRVMAIVAFIASQAADDKELKFTQAELDHTPLIDFYVDVHCEPTKNVKRLEALIDAANRRQNQPLHPGAPHSYYPPGRTIGAANLLCQETDGQLRSVVFEGAPGQGKSTLGQFLCQINRVRILDWTEDIAKLPVQFAASPLTLPIRVDLRDVASWLAGDDPFHPGQKHANPTISLDAFISDLITFKSGGSPFGVADFQALIAGSPSLIVLDGLDEVPDVNTRNKIIDMITGARNRYDGFAKHLRLVVTTRPAIFANSRTFDASSFGHLRLVDLDLKLVFEYTEKWLRQRGISGRNAEEITQTLRTRLQSSHIRNLTRNPMQLAILLYLIQRRSVSLPEKRTALYTAYLDSFLDRESEKSDVVLQYRDLVIELHGFLAWKLHAEAELGANGRITEASIKEVLTAYLEYERQPVSLVDDLFAGMVERVVMLVSRLQGTYEFEVQPLREYFAARYLYEQAPTTAYQPDRRGTKPDRFDAISRRPYWLNVTRFYAGFYDKGELADLARRINDLNEAEWFGRTCYSRSLAFYLLADHVFDSSQRDVPSIVDHAADALGLRAAVNDYSRVQLLPPDFRGYKNMQVMTALPMDGGRSEIAAKYLEKLVRPGPPALANRWQEGLRANSSSVERRQLWLDIRDRVASRTDWLIAGSGLGIFRAMAKPELDEIFRGVDESLVRTLVIRGRAERWVDSDAAALSLLRSLANPHHTTLPIPIGGDAKPWWLHRIIHRANARHLSLWREEYAEQFIISESGDGDVDTVGLPTEAAYLIDCLALTWFKDRDWRKSLEPYADLCGTVASAIGVGWRTSEIALVGATISNASIRGGRLVDSEVEDAQHLVKALRHLRLSKDPEVWAQWVEIANSSHQQWLKKTVLVALLCWADPQVVVLHRKICSQWVASLASADLVSVQNVKESIDRIAQPGRPRRPSFGRVVCDRLFGKDMDVGYQLLCLFRVDPSLVSKVSDRIAAGWRTVDLETPAGGWLAANILPTLLACAPSEREDTWLQDVQRVWSVAWPVESEMPRSSRRRYPVLTEKESIAFLDIADNAPDLALFSAEDFAFNRAVGLQEAVADVARAEGWFPGEVWSRD